MRAISSAASISIHAAAAAALLLGTTKQPKTKSTSIDTITAFVPEPRQTAGIGGGGGGEIQIPRVDWSMDPGTIRSLAPVLQPGALSPTFSTDWAPSSTGGGVGNGGDGGVGVAELAPEVLAGPLPLYPDLLRQAGVEGQVVLEARGFDRPDPEGLCFRGFCDPSRFCRTRASGPDVYAVSPGASKRAGGRDARPGAVCLLDSGRHGTCSVTNRRRVIRLSSFCNLPPLAASFWRVQLQGASRPLHPGGNGCSTT